MAVFNYNYFPDIHEFHNSLQKRTIIERIDRPKAPVLFSFNGKSTMRMWCLLDSGADHFLLPSDIAIFLGIDLTKANEYKTTVAGGGNILTKRHEIDVIFEGRIFSTFADFSDSHPYPLLGRKFFEFFDSVTFKEKAKQVELVLSTKSN